MRTRFFLYPFLFAILASSVVFAAKPTPAPKATAAVTAAATISKPVVDQTAQTIIYCYHRLVDKVRYPGTEITPAAFEAQMKELKDKESQSFRCRIYSLGNGAKRTYRRAAL